MAWRMGLLGKKVGMTQSFTERGAWQSHSVVELGPCVVVDKKTPERDGYSALLLGFGEKPLKRTNKAQAGIFAKAQTSPKRYTREFRLTEEEAAAFEVGQTLRAEQVFSAGDTVDVCGTSRGKGFQGVMKRHNFSGIRASHGTHEYFRHGGSIGCRLTPGRVVKGRPMAGQMGNRRITVQNLTVREVIADKNLILLSGAVPGAPDGLVQVKFAAKRNLGAFKLRANATTETGGSNAAEDQQA